MRVADLLPPPLRLLCYVCLLIGPLYFLTRTIQLWRVEPSGTRRALAVSVTLMACVLVLLVFLDPR